MDLLFLDVHLVFMLDLSFLFFDGFTDELHLLLILLQLFVLFMDDFV